MALQSIVSENLLGDFYLLSGLFHPSTISVGTWSFDFMLNGSAESLELAVDFISLSTYRWELGEEETKNYGFYVGWFRPSQYEIYKNTKFPSATYLLMLCNSPSGTEKDVWHHVDITRGEDGRICVYVDGVLGIDVVDNEYKESKYFGVHLEYSHRGKALIDNIVVSDTVDIEPPPSEDQSGVSVYQIGLVLIFTIMIIIMVRAVQSKS